MNNDSKNPLEIVIVGHVDHGKSTLVGRLFNDTGSMPEGKFEAIEAMCKRRGVPFEWAFLMDALRAERDQNITIDTSHIWFQTAQRPYVIIDAPGHREFLKNMITGAASANAALLVIAADEGVQEQSRRHGYMLSLLGIRQIAVVVNKMDLVGYSHERFFEIEAEYRDFLAQLGVTPRYFVPVAARDGENVAASSQKMRWYDGPSVVQTLDLFERPAGAPQAALRFPVQDVYRFDHRRIIAGRVESGTLHVGDMLQFLPTGKTARVASIEAWRGDSGAPVSAGFSVGVTLDQQLFVERGHIAVRVGESLPRLARQMTANVFWLGTRPLQVGAVYKLKLATQELGCRVAAVDAVLDASTLEPKPGSPLLRDDVATVTFEFDRPLVVDLQAEFVSTGRFVLVDGYDVCGGGIVTATSDAVRANTRVLDDETRYQFLGFRGAVVSVSGELEHVQSLERVLVESGVVAAVADLEHAQALSRAGVVALVRASEGAFDLTRDSLLDVATRIRLQTRV